MSQHDGPVTDRAPGRRDPSPSTFGTLLNVAGIVVVALFLWRAGTLGMPGWIAILAAVGLVGWLLRELLPVGSPAGLAAALVAVAASSLVAVPTGVTGYVAGLVCMAALLASPRRPLALGLATAVGSGLLVAVTALPLHAETGVLLGAGAGLAIAVLVGVSRRQSRAAASRERDLLEERLRLEEERGRTAALAERSRIARDIHDVLAHSLGGLVIQLDAVDALLESGRVDDARSRAAAARGLAASGLDEARRAVDALRDPDAAADLAGAIDELVATHRSLGSAAELRVDGDPVELAGDGAGALRRAAQEVLSNARRHAPGASTELELSWTPDAAILTATTPLTTGDPTSGPGGGRGLAGLRERVAALGGRAEWSVRDGAFQVTAEVPARPIEGWRA
jgi:signal transduction histidine kinase